MTVKDDTKVSVAKVDNSNIHMSSVNRITNNNDDGIADDGIDEDYDISIVEQMLQACESNDTKVIHHIIDTHGIMYGCYAIPSTGMTPLMMASSMGHVHLVEYLLTDCGAPWNALDRQYQYCAGDYATQSQHWDIVNQLVDWATRAEFILGAIERHTLQRNQTLDTSVLSSNVTSNNNNDNHLKHSHNESSTKPDYLRQRLQYTPDGNALMDADQDAVMMEWERPIMKAHAQLMMMNNMESSTVPNEKIPMKQQRVLNVGFGMGIIDTILQDEYTPGLHIIIEAHPDVYQHMIQKGWDQKPNVRICFGTWQTVVPQLRAEGCVLDAIFFDTYGEHYMDMEDFHEQMVHLLAKPHGIYSFFNGLAPDNLFFHGVACQCVKIQLAALGIDSEFVPCEIQVPDETVWKDIRRKYWYGRDTYYLPICTWNQEYITTDINPNADIVTKLLTTTTNPKRKYESITTSTTTTAVIRQNDCTQIAESVMEDMDDTTTTTTPIHDDDGFVVSKRLQSSFR